MDYLDRQLSGQRISVVGLGAGGPSRLGTRTGKSRSDSVALVRRALDLGINYIDTAEAYDTEPIVGEALRQVARESVLISTKKSPRHQDDTMVSPADFMDGVHDSLRRLQTDYIDVFHLHAVRARHYDYVRDELVPVLQTMRAEGIIRHLAISEAFHDDSGHEMLQQALVDDCWDVVMVGFNILNQSARKRVLPQTREKGVLTEVMFAVRRAFSRPERLREILTDLAQRGEIERSQFDWSDPLGFVLEESDAHTLAEAAYRFCRHEPGLDIVLTGTGDVAHLEENVSTLLKPPLPKPLVDRLKHLFDGVDSVSGS